MKGNSQDNNFRNVLRREWYQRNKARLRQYHRERYIPKLNKKKAAERLTLKENRELRPLQYRFARTKRPKAKNEKERVERHHAFVKRWQANNRERLRNYERTRFRNNIQFRLAKCLRNRLFKVLSRSKNYKHTQTTVLLGCSIDDFRIYLESKFETGMTWENCGPVWHIDHIIPCSSFDLSKPEHQKRCFHFSNMQPMFATDNMRKWKYIKDNQFRLL